MTDARIADDSDSQWSDLIRRRVTVSPISRPYWWTVPEDERERIAAAVPDGYRLVIVPGYKAKPGTCDVSLRDERNSNVKGPNRGMNVARLCWSVLPRLVVTADGDGWVTDLEEA